MSSIEQGSSNSGRATVALPSDTEILITRTFAAPRHLVFRAVTTPELVRRWWAGKRGDVTHAEIDLRVGGTWRYVMNAQGGFEVAFHGRYLEIVPDERLVSTEVFEGYPDAEATNTVTLSDVDGGTLMQVLVRHTQPEHRDAHINSGMEGGMQESYDALEDVARSLVGQPVG
jgi:uncharacterized protein YndB with AHSA1/START domain